MKKAPEAFRTISEVSDLLETPAHVLRFWESKFYQIRPVKRAGGRRYYRPDDVALINGIRTLLQDQGMTIRGVQRILQEEGLKHVVAIGSPLPLHDDAETVIDIEVETATSDEDLAIDAGYPEPNDAEADVPDDVSTNGSGDRIAPTEVPSIDAMEPIVEINVTRPGAQIEKIMAGPEALETANGSAAAPEKAPGSAPAAGAFVADPMRSEPPEPAEPSDEPVMDTSEIAEQPAEHARARMPKAHGFPASTPMPGPASSDMASANQDAASRPPERIAHMLRSLDRGKSGPGRENLAVLARRIDALLERMSEASGAGRW